MLRGRKSRAKTFRQQEDVFLNTASKRKFQPTMRDGRKVIIGSKKMGGQLIRKRPEHVEQLRETLAFYFRALLNGAIKPKKYVLVQLLTGVASQEYVHSPSVWMLRKYFSKQRYLPLSPAEYLLCKNFVNQYKRKGFAEEKMEEAFKEFDKDNLSIHPFLVGNLSETNVVVLGFIKERARTNAGKVRFALVDI